MSNDFDNLQSKEKSMEVPGPTEEGPPVSLEEIANLSYKQGLRLVRDKLKMNTENLRKLEDIQKVLRLRYYPEKTEECSYDGIQKQLQECLDKQRDIMAICQMLEESLMQPQYKEAIQEIIKEMEPDFDNTWESKVKTLQHRMENNDCSILIAGETGSGKSSLINLLVGDNLVPEAEHPCTSALCTIRGSKSNKEYVNLWEDKSKMERVDLNNLSDLTETEREKKREKVNNFITFIYGKEDTIEISKSMDRRAEFFCNMELLKCGACFVDTPGFRELPRLTKILYTHLPKASAFIIVLRTDNNTGYNPSVEDFIDKVREILDELTMKKVEANDPNEGLNNLTGNSLMDSVIFVFNRWDQIVDFNDSKEVERVRQMCLNQLEHKWPGLEVGKNVFFMSVKKTNSMIKCSKRSTPEFIAFQKALYSMVPRSLNNHLRTAHRWLEFLNSMFLTISRKKLNMARMDDKQRKARVLQLRDHLKSTEETYATRASEFTRLLTIKRRELLNTLLNHLKSEAAINRMIDIDNDDRNYAPVQMKPMEPISGMTDFDGLRIQLNSYCMDRVANEVKFWNEKDAYHYNEKDKIHIFDNKKTKFSNFLEDIGEIFNRNFREINEQAKFLNELFDCNNVIPRPDDVQDDMPRTHFLSGLEKVFFGMTAVIWVPLVIVGGAISLPVIAGILVNDSIISKSKMYKFNNKRKAIIEKCIRSLVKHFGKRDLNEFIHPSVFKSIRTFETRVKGYLPMLIEKYEKQITILENDGENLATKEEKFSPVRRKAEEILSNLYLFHMHCLKSFEFSKDKLIGFQCLESSMSSEDFLERNTVETRNFGTFGDVGITYRDDKRDVTLAVKIIDEPISAANAFRIFSEEAMWRRVSQKKNKHVLYFHGVLAFGEKHQRMAFVMEACDCHLEQYLNNHPKLIPFHQENMDEKEVALRTILKLSIQITDGLDYMHGLKILHRRMRIDNILVSVCAGVVTLKLCDFGDSRGHSQVTATICESSYIRTEVLEKKGWTESADVYALGLILWEMYNGRRFDKKQLYEKSEDGVITGQNGIKLDSRLDFPDPDTPSLFMEIIERTTVAKDCQITTAKLLKADITSFLSKKSSLYLLKRGNKRSSVEPSPTAGDPPTCN